MTITIDTTTASLIAAIATGTGKSVGDGEMPKPAPASADGYYIVYTIPGGSTSGGMANDLEMAEIIYQLKIVGHSNEQCRKYQQLLHEKLALAWSTITGCMGPARIAVGGIVKEDETTFVANDTMYMQITGG